MNYFIEVWKKFGTFEGRARRAEYWYFVLFNTIISYALVFIDISAGTQYLNVVYSLAALVPSIAVGVRRMHDVGKSGWFLLIPIYNLILAVTAGDEGENKYGKDPKNPFAEDDIVNHLVE